MPQTQLPYRYKRLTSTATTRLVQIQPSTASGSGLVVNIVEAFPSGPLEYDALSYTWGTAEPDKPIVANNDRRLLVTDNLAKAMRRFRHATEVVSLWIDQLCIDQRNARERSLQVAMMGTIYRSARKVIVWLGDDVQDDGVSQLNSSRVCASPARSSTSCARSPGSSSTGATAPPAPCRALATGPGRPSQRSSGVRGSAACGSSKRWFCRRA